jgi:hypothetical protein
MEKIESLNRQLTDEYGLDSSTGRSIFRIVWANDQTEKRLVEELDSGIRLLYPVVMEVKKYSYLKDFWVLERLVVVPDINARELPTSKLSYEPVWGYRDSLDRPIPPTWESTKFVVDTLYAALGKKSMAKYVENTGPEVREQRITKLHEELFGNETEITDALTYKEGIVVPSNYNSNKKKES